MDFRKVIAIAVLSLPCHRAAECDVASGECNKFMDELSLVQVKKIVEFGRERVHQEPETTVETSTSEESESACGNPIECAEKVANAKVYAADEALHEKISDRKVAKANDLVQKFATQTAKWKMKQAQAKFDMKKAGNYTAKRRKTRADRQAIDQALAASSQAEAWDTAQTAESAATNLSQAADKIYAARDVAYKTAAKKKAYALAKYQESLKAAKDMETIVNANYTVSDAADSANTAATARLRSDYASQLADTAKQNVSDAQGQARLADQNRSRLVKAARKAEHKARAYARAYWSTAKAAYAGNMSEAPETTVETEVTKVIEEAVPASDASAAEAAVAPASDQSSETKTSSEQTIHVPR